MSEIQRYRITNEEYGFTKSIPAPDGYWCYASDLLWYRNQYRMAMAFTLVTVLACAVLAGYLVYHKHDPQIVKVPVGVEERAEMFKEREGYEKQIKDLKDANVFYKAQIRHLNTAISNKQAQIDIVSPKIDSALAIGEKVSQLNNEQAKKMNTHQGMVLEAKRVLGVSNVKIIE